MKNLQAKKIKKAIDHIKNRNGESYGEKVNLIARYLDYRLGFGMQLTTKMARKAVSE
jgi:hypothetical protein